MQNRRDFLGAAAALAAGSSVFAGSPAPANDIRLGLFVSAGKDPEPAFKKVRDLGLNTCQMSVEIFTPEMKKALKDGQAKYNVEITAMNTHGPGKTVWDFYQGPLTIGIVPRETRRARIDHMKRGADFAKECGFTAIHGHVGFIPENPNDPMYHETVEALHEVVSHYKQSGINILYETGQESPITMLRAIQEVGLDNQFVNLDTANLILYGKGNPLDALDVIGPLVRGIHAKDGLFPTNPKQLGKEVPIGQGKVDFPKLIQRLRALNYRGAMTIEREISGPQQLEDIRKEKAYLEKLLG